MYRFVILFHFHPVWYLLFPLTFSGIIFRILLGQKTTKMFVSCSSFIQKSSVYLFLVFLFLFVCLFVLFFVFCFCFVLFCFCFLFLFLCVWGGVSHLQEKAHRLTTCFFVLCVGVVCVWHIGPRHHLFSAITVPHEEQLQRNSLSKKLWPSRTWEVKVTIC